MEIIFSISAIICGLLAFLFIRWIFRQSRKEDLANEKYILEKNVDYFQRMRDARYSKEVQEASNKIMENNRKRTIETQKREELNRRSEFWRDY